MDNKYFIAFVVGFILELSLTKLWTYPTLTYFLGVPIFIVLLWAVLLPLGYDIRNKVLRNKTILNQVLIILPGLYVIEWFGSNVLKIKLSVASQYPSLLPGCCNAPLWLYGVYLVVIIGYWGYLDGR